MLMVSQEFGRILMKKHAAEASMTLDIRIIYIYIFFYIYIYVYTCTYIHIYIYMLLRNTHRNLRSAMNGEV